MVALFHVIEKELEWRRARGQLEGFEAMLSSKPLVAVGAEHPLEDEMLMADHFRKNFDSLITKKKANSSIDGIDGLAGVHESVSCFILLHVFGKKVTFKGCQFFPPPEASRMNFFSVKFIPQITFSSEAVGRAIIDMFRLVPDFSPLA